ncbi:MAG: hypothetical protein QXP94_01255 [Thermofilaceae archaeon]
MSLELEWDEGQILGIANQTLTPDIAASLGGALGTMLGEGALVVTARDNYPPSRMLKRAFSAGLMSTGISVMDFHSATTPELIFAIKRLGAKAGVQFTVAPLERDGIAIKIFDSQGLVFSIERMEELFDRAGSGKIVRSLPAAIGWVTYAEYVHDIYAAAIAGYLDSHTIASKRYRMVCDVNFGPASEVLPNLFSELGIEGVMLNAHRPPFRGSVTHMPDPHSIEMLKGIVRASDAALGVSFCADATRALVVDDEGKPLSGEEVASLIALGMPAGTRIIVSESMGSMIDEVCKKIGARVVRVRGLKHDLIRAARRSGSHLVATSGNEIIFTDFSLSPDGMLATLKLLEYIAKTDQSLSSARDSLPKVQMISRTVKLGGVNYLSALKAIYRSFRTAMLTITGLRVRVDSIWVNVEASRDRIELSCESVEGADEIIDRFAEKVSGLIRELKVESAS